MSLPAQPLDQEHALKCELASEVLRLSGQLRLRVTGWSMLPSIWPGDTLILERATGSDLAEGDIVLFGRDRRFFAHRVLKAGQDAIHTRGDAMPYNDAPVTQSELLGRVAYIVRNQKRIQPAKTLPLSQRAVAGLVRSSDVGARVVVGIHGMFQSKTSQS